MAARGALWPASVVLAIAEEFGRIIRVLNIAGVCMTIAHATSSNTDILDGVEVLDKKRVYEGCYFVRCYFPRTLTRLVTVVSCLATDIKCPNKFFVLKNRNRTFVALVHSWRTLELKYMFAEGRLWRREIGISPPSRGTILEYPVLHMTESSRVIGCKLSLPK